MPTTEKKDVNKLENIRYSEIRPDIKRIIAAVERAEFARAMGLIAPIDYPPEPPFSSRFVTRCTSPWNRAKQEFQRRKNGAKRGLRSAQMDIELRQIAWDVFMEINTKENNKCVSENNGAIFAHALNFNGIIINPLSGRAPDLLYTPWQQTRLKARYCVRGFIKPDTYPAHKAAP